MEQNELKSLIKRYWAAETSPDEEREIRKKFTENRMLPSDLEQFRNWFEGTVSAELGDEFDEKILREIDSKSSIKAALEPGWRWLSAAACIAVIVFAGWKALKPQEQFVADEMTETDVIEALETVKSMLYFTSAEMKRAEKEAMTQLKTVNIMNEVITIKQ
jgi:hypothetical protein